MSALRPTPKLERRSESAGSTAGSALALRPFDARWAGEIAQWVSDEMTLRLLAPGTAAPLTAEKVADWGKPGGFGATGWVGGQPWPIAYGEINPMLKRKGCYWLGHVIVRPGWRGRGNGLTFVRSLLRHAFDNMSAKLIALIVFPENTSAVECYLSAGFRVTGEELHTFRPDARQEKLLRLEINSKRMGVP